MHKTGKGQDCQILLERKSAVIEVWHGITYLTSPCRWWQAKRNHKFSMCQFRVHCKLAL